MEITENDIVRNYRASRSYQEIHFDEIADAIRYVDGTTKPNDPIIALDFAKRIRRLKGNGSGGNWTGDCCFGDNIPTGCGDIHGLLALDYKLVNCVTARMKPPNESLGEGCLCEDNFAYTSTMCGYLHGLNALDYRIVDVNFESWTLWGYDADAS